MPIRDNNNQENILLIECHDQPGLISAVSTILFKNGCNITNNREYVDTSKNKFFMRTAFIGGKADSKKLLTELESALPEDAQISLPAKGNKRIVVLATTEHHCLAELLLRNEYGEIKTDIQAVVSNHDTLSEFTARFKIKYQYASSEENNSQEKEILELLKEYKPDYLVLAKYMRVLSPKFIGQYKNRIINIHHSFLPAFVGANPYRQAHERGVKIIGATAHFATDDLDQGPIIAQDTIKIDHTYSVKDMQQAGRDIEKSTLTKALALVCDDRIFINGNKTIVFD